LLYNISCSSQQTVVTMKKREAETISGSRSSRKIPGSGLGLFLKLLTYNSSLVRSGSAIESAIGSPSFHDPEDLLPSSFPSKLDTHPGIKEFNFFCVNIMLLLLSQHLSRNMSHMDVLICLEIDTTTSRRIIRVILEILPCNASEVEARIESCTASLP